MAQILRDDLIQSIADSLQYISYYHSADFLQAYYRAYEKEESAPAKDAMAQILVNSKMAAIGHRPMCSDTGIVNVFVKVGSDVQWEEGIDVSKSINEGIRRAYQDPENTLRASILEDPDGARRNTGDNTPGVIHYEIVPGNTVHIHVAAKGGGSEAKSNFAMLNPSDSVVDWVMATLPTMGAGWCPPGILGLGIGGTAEKAMLLAKESLMAPIDIDQLRERGARNRCEELRLEIFEKANNLGIGAQGLGGLTTVLDVKVLDYPTHAANKAVALIPNCAATRHAHFLLDGSGPAELQPPNLDEWPDIPWNIGEDIRRVDVDKLSKNDVKTWKSGEKLMLTGRILTARDAALERLVGMIDKGESLPVDFSDRIMFHVGPVKPVRDEVVGPTTPTTITRMDKFTDSVLRNTGLLGMLGKGERGPIAVDALKEHGAVSLIGIGGAGYLISKAIRSAKLLAFEDLGMEAIYEFTVEDMPVTVAVDSSGESIHRHGPRVWQKIILEMP